VSRNFAVSGFGERFDGCPGISLKVPVPLRLLFASKPAAIGPVLGIVHRVIAGWLADQAGVERSTAQCGAVTLIQRFGSALSLNIRTPQHPSNRRFPTVKPAIRP